MIETMQNGGFSSTSSAAVFYDCSILALGFTSVEFSVCLPKANSAAHEIDRHSFLNFSTYF